MKTDDLLRRALLKAALPCPFTRTGPSPGLLYPAGAHACTLPLREGAPAAELRFAASELGVPRVEMTLLLPGDLAGADTVALYQRVQHVHDLCWPCHFSRHEATRHIQVRAQVFTRCVLDPGEPGVDEFPLAPDATSLARWIRTSYASSKLLLSAYAGQVS
ncbi:hypothetical protein H8N03_06730 [Ramlibacter sp. USB13]|uniref:Uncharacterized protein n=1 Tax=Ramlibacter cellulosilyticus TaxID=2764187 RepID=A0A923SAC7_9BURK|nr:hypothetical protein [Ramlibacter cellulosilyticus]MBC5782634.1 hypothetical protein [Ramlibacter cellulosilyticus]